jgi:hypothetical protein
MIRQFAAVASLVLDVVAFGLLTIHVTVDFPRGAFGFALLALAVVCAWHGVLRRGPLRVAGIGAGALLVAVAAALAMTERPALSLGVYGEASCTRLDSPRAPSSRAFRSSAIGAAVS